MRPAFFPFGRALALAALALALAATAAPPSDFTVTAPADGQVFRLADARGKYVALHFLLKTECPVCLRHTAAHAKLAAAQPDVLHVFLKPDSAAEIQGWTAKLAPGTAPVIYRDPDARLAKAFAIPDGYAFHGELVHYPALVLLDPAGRKVFRHVGKNNGDRFSAEKLTAKIAELKQAAAK
jgi:peroxiredoxin Q/BCP